MVIFLHSTSLTAVTELCKLFWSLLGYPSCHAEWLRSCALWWASVLCWNQGEYFSHFRVVVVWQVAEQSQERRRKMPLLLLHTFAFSCPHGFWPLIYDRESCWSQRHSKRKPGRLNMILACLWWSYTAFALSIAYIARRRHLYIRESTDSLIPDFGCCRRIRSEQVSFRG